MRILVVEDERRVANFVCRALRENAYAVDLADTGEKALEMASETSYDSILPTSACQALAAFRYAVNSGTPGSILQF